MVSTSKVIIEEESNVEPRKTRATSAGVADLMKTLKPKKKGPDKARRKGEAAMGGTHSSSPIL